MFGTFELQILNVDKDGGSGKFAEGNAIKAFACRVVNGGNDAAFVKFAGEESYIPAGESLVIDKGPVAEFSARAEEEETRLYFHAGKETFKNG